MAPYRSVNQARNRDAGHEDSVTKIGRLELDECGGAFSRATDASPLLEIWSCSERQKAGEGMLVQPFRFTQTYITRADLPEALSVAFGRCEEADIRVAHLEGLACDPVHRDAVCAAVLARVESERLPWERTIGGQKIVGHQHVIAIATVDFDGNEDPSIPHALAAARAMWGPCLRIAEWTSREGKVVLTCLLVPSATGMRARAEFDSFYRQKRHGRSGSTPAGSAKPSTSSATNLMRVGLVPVAQSDDAAVVDERHDALSRQESLARSDIRFVDANGGRVGATRALHRVAERTGPEARPVPGVLVNGLENSCGGSADHDVPRAAAGSTTDVPLLNAAIWRQPWQCGSRLVPPLDEPDRTLPLPEASPTPSRSKGMTKLGHVDRDPRLRSISMVHTARARKRRCSGAEVVWESSRPSQSHVSL